MITGSLFLILGVVFSFLPHDIHNIDLSGGHDIHEHGSHDIHIGSGFIISFIGMVIIILGWKVI